MTPEDRHWYNSAPLPAEILPVESVEDSNLRFTFDYWRKLKGERPMPARAEILPKDLKQCLRYIHIYDVIDNGADFRARLVGTSVFPASSRTRPAGSCPSIPIPASACASARCSATSPRRARRRGSLSRRITGSMMHDLYTEGLWLPLGVDGSVLHVLAQSSLRQMKPGSDARPSS